LRYRAIWHGSTLHAEVDRIRSIHAGRQPTCQKSNKSEVSQTPETFTKKKKAKGVGSSLLNKELHLTSKKEEPIFKEYGLTSRIYHPIQGGASRVSSNYRNDLITP
jgi:hypothetical protein